MTTDFSTLGIGNELNEILTRSGIIQPTSIQIQAIPILMTGNDVIGQAQTGTGKTLAFLLPIMERIDVGNPDVQALIITPTRELALQITHEAKKLAAAKDINILAAYGGQDVERQIKKLKGAVHMVIGTPGRLVDHINRKSIDLSHLAFLVLDEADQMLDMGFLTDVEQIIRKTPNQRQTMLFSATMPKGIKTLASNYMQDPIRIHVQGKSITLEEIKQIVIETTDRGKQDALCTIIDEYKPFMAIIFCRTKRRAGALNEALQSRGYSSDELHGDLTQAKREKVVKSFRKAEIQLLVATDVAARGLDIEGITHIFNYDIPQDAESYIHRIGRTGRAGQTGVAVTLATPRDHETLNIIEKGIRITLEKWRIAKTDMMEDSKISRDLSGYIHKPYTSKSKNPEHAFGRAGNNRGKNSSKKQTSRNDRANQGQRDLRKKGNKK